MSNRGYFEVDPEPDSKSVMILFHFLHIIPLVYTLNFILFIHRIERFQRVFSEG